MFRHQSSSLRSALSVCFSSLMLDWWTNDRLWTANVSGKKFDLSHDVVRFFGLELLSLLETNPWASYRLWWQIRADVSRSWDTNVRSTCFLSNSWKREPLAGTTSWLLMVKPQTPGRLLSPLLESNVHECGGLGRGERRFWVWVLNSSFDLPPTQNSTAWGLLLYRWKLKGCLILNTSVSILCRNSQNTDRKVYS